MKKINIINAFLSVCLLAAPSLVVAKSSFVFNHQNVAEMEKDGRMYAEGGAKNSKSDANTRSGGWGGRVGRAEGGA